MSEEVRERYKVCSDDKRTALEAEINALMSEGWQPLGGVVVTYYEAARMSHFRFTQTMVTIDESGSPRQPSGGSE